MKKILYFILLFVVLMSCDSKVKKEKLYDSKIESMFGKHFKQQLYQRASDTLLNWVNNNLLIDSVTSNSGKSLIWEYKLDSTICVNRKGNKLIGTIHQFGLCKDVIDSDDIREFYGAKINGRWYFWLGGAMPILRKSFKNHDLSKPLSYAQLHKAAMENFLGGYLTKNGETNEEWFEFHFKNNGLFKFEDRYKFKWILDGERIDDEGRYWNYIWKKKGTMLWKRKAYQNSSENLKNK